MSRGVNRKIGCCKCVIASQCIYSISVCISFRSEKKKNNNNNNNNKKKKKKEFMFISHSVDLI